MLSPSDIFTVLYPEVDKISEKDHRLRVCLTRGEDNQTWDTVYVILPYVVLDTNSECWYWWRSATVDRRAMVVVSDKHPAHSHLFQRLAGLVMARALNEEDARLAVLYCLDLGKGLGCTALSDMQHGADAQAEDGRSIR